MLDSKGTPLLFYHGSRAIFHEFRLGVRRNPWADQNYAVYFTPDPFYALTYGNVLYSAHLRMKSPRRVVNEGAACAVTELQARRYRDSGFDGLVAEFNRRIDPPSRVLEYVVFSTAQIYLVDRQIVDRPQMQAMGLPDYLSAQAVTLRSH